jgi:hypothetical protein
MKFIKYIGIIIVVYILVIVVLGGVFYFTKGQCNEFVSYGPPVKQSVLCKPIIYLIGIPVHFISELFEAIVL